MTIPRRTAQARVEVVAVASVLAVALGLLVPAIVTARASDHRTRCADHLRAIGQAANQYSAANDGMLPRNNAQSPSASWGTQLLPYLGEERLARQYAPGRNWWDAEKGGNREVAQARISTYLCPAAPNPDRWVLTQDPDDAAQSFKAAPTDYVGSAGAYYQNNDQSNLHPGAMHTRKITQRIRIADIADGASHTLLVVEMADKPNQWRAGKLAEDRLNRAQMPAINGQWAAPNWNHLRSYSADGRDQFGPCAVNCSNGASIYGFHEGGANCLFVDGSVKFLRAGLSQEMLIALVSIAGGEVLSSTDF